MGSWNATCMISKLPILYGEECVAFLIAKTIGKPTSGSPTGKWRPISPPIFGKYADYGCLDSVKNGDPLITAFNSHHSFSVGISSNRNMTNQEILEVSEVPFLSGDDAESPSFKKATFDSMETLLKTVERDYYGQTAIMARGAWSQYEDTVGLVLIKTAFFDLALKQFAEIKKETENLEEKLRSTSQKDTDGIIERLHLKEELFSPKFWTTPFPHPMLNRLCDDKISIAGIVAVANLLDEVLIHWAPAQGSGRDEGIWKQRQVDFYRLMFKEASTMYDQYKYDSGEE